MFYDLETRQDTGTHVVNYVNTQDFDGNEFTFENIELFCKFIFGQHGRYTFIAHNAKSFDVQFILKYCIDNAIKPFCIYNGTKIMYMYVKEFNLLHEYRDLFIDKAVRNNRSKLAIANRHQER